MIEIEERPIADVIDGIPAPAQCENVIGHQDVLERLFETYRSGRMHHAWLLTGPQGIGKATLALTFSKFLFSFPDRSNLPEHFDASLIQQDIHRQVAQGAHPLPRWAQHNVPAVSYKQRACPFAKFSKLKLYPNAT